MAGLLDNSTGPNSFQLPYQQSGWSQMSGLEKFAALAKPGTTTDNSAAQSNADYLKRLREEQHAGMVRQAASQQPPAWRPVPPPAMGPNYAPLNSLFGNSVFSTNGDAFAPYRVKFPSWMQPAQVGNAGTDRLPGLLGA